MTVCIRTNVRVDRRGVFRTRLYHKSGAAVWTGGFNDTEVPKTCRRLSFAVLIPSLKIQTPYLRLESLPDSYTREIGGAIPAPRFLLRYI